MTISTKAVFINSDVQTNNDKIQHAQMDVRNFDGDYKVAMLYTLFLPA